MKKDSDKPKNFWHKTFVNYKGFWLVLVVAFVIFAILSMCDSITIFNHEFKSSKIWPTLTASHKNETVTDSVAADTVVEVTFPVPVDTVPKKIMFIGDSMLDGLSPRLAAYANENGHELYSVIWYSSSTEAWGKTDKLESYINELHPDYIFIALGSNELFIRDIEEKRDQYVKKILADIGDIPYIWIGPPNWKPDTGINDMLLKNIGPHRYFVTNGMEFPRMRDGAHPTHEAAIGWMDSVMRWMAANSDHPIKMNFPSEKKGRANHIYMHQPSEIP